MKSVYDIGGMPYLHTAQNVINSTITQFTAYLI